MHLKLYMIYNSLLDRVYVSRVRQSLYNSGRIMCFGVSLLFLDVLATEGE